MLREAFCPAEPASTRLSPHISRANKQIAYAAGSILSGRAGQHAAVAAYKQSK